MIDIHCHLLYGVDDGARTMEESVAMLKEAHDQGIGGIILTPHYRHGMFSYPVEAIADHFMKLKPCAEKLGIVLGLGTEYHVNSRIIEALESGRCRTLAGTGYVLTEYSHDSSFSYLEQMTEELVRHGYIPVIANAERYGCMTGNMEPVKRIRRMGAWIQLNADAVLGLEGMATKRFCRKLLKEELADVIASDCHGITRRACHMEKCRQMLEKKYSVEYADQLLRKNPGKILEGSCR